jgi:GntR family transcriptional regulator
VAGRNGTGDGSSPDERLVQLWETAAREGRTLPGEPTLAHALSISRPAVREALIRLEERGYIRRRQGADTVVNSSLLGIPARFDQRVEMSEMIRAMGCAPSVEVLDVSTTTITIEEAAEHDLPPATPVRRVTKRWTADEVPVLIAHDSVPLPKAPRDEAGADPALPLVDLAHRLTGERPGWEVVRPSAGLLDAQAAAWADLAEDDPALSLDISGISWHGRVYYWTRELHLRNFFRYALVRRAEWRPARPGTD